jgi:hypothetical protein
MPGYKEIWPLAFVLAAASGSAQADAPVDTDPAAFFRAGSLSDTLRDVASRGEGSEDKVGSNRIQLSQWFNFFNCFSGVWRKC